MSVIKHTLVLGNLLSNDQSTLYLDASSGFDATLPIKVVAVVATRLGNSVTFKEMGPSALLSNFSVPSKILEDVPFTLTDPVTNSAGAFTYTSSNPLVATVSGSTVTIIGTGTTTITATQAATATHASNSISATFTVLILPTLSNFSVPTKAVGAAPFTLTAPISNSTGAFTYTSSNPAVAIVIGSTVTIVGAGTTTITATQAATATHLSNSISATFTVIPLATLSNFSVTSREVGATPFALTAPQSNSTGAFTYTSSNLAVATISGSTVTVVGAGTTTITATQAATATHGSNSITATFTVSSASANANASAIGYAVVTTNNSTYNDDLVVAQNINNSYQTLTGDDTKVTVVLQNPFLFNNINYNTIYINSNGTIGFNTASNTDSYSPTLATASTMAAFFLSWADTNDPIKIYYKEDVISKIFTLIYDRVYLGSSIPCKSGIKLFLDNSGKAIINFGAIGSSNTSSLLGFSFGSSIQSNLITTWFNGNFVPLQSPLINITSVQANYANKQIVITTYELIISYFSVPTKIIGDAPFDLTAPVSKSDGAFTYTSSNPAVATVTGSTVTIVGDGTTTITATQAATATYASNSIITAFTVTLPPWVQRGEDIDGEAAVDYSGIRVSISSDGNVVAIGADGNDGNGSSAGHVRVYAWNGTAWVKRGQDIDGEAAGDYSGGTVSISSDGNVVAIGAHYNDGNGTNAGHVRVYAWNGTAWVKRGQDIDGEAAYDYSGRVSISLDGNVVAIGAHYNDGNGSDAGHVRVYAWNGTAWVKRGEDIDGEAAVDYSGTSVSISSDGNVVAIGASYNDGNGNNTGHVRVYAWNGTAWVKRGLDIDGEAAGDISGGTVSISSDGNVVAIGASSNDGNGTNAGHVRVYAWNGTAWVKRGEDIDGEAAYDSSGTSVSISSDGNVVAIGASGNDGNGSNAGHVRVYYF
jgi:pyrimidine deaminase RibD-like protein